MWSQIKSRLALNCREALELKPHRRVVALQGKEAGLEFTHSSVICCGLHLLSSHMKPDRA